MCSGYPQVSVAKEPIGVKEPLSDTVAYLTKHQIVFFHQTSSEEDTTSNQGQADSFLVSDFHSHLNMRRELKQNVCQMATKGEDVVEIISKLNSLVVLTYHNIDAIMRPTAMQSTNTTHNKNFKNPKKGSFNITAKPIEDAEDVKGNKD